MERYILVLEPDALIAEDVREALKEFATDDDVVHVSDLNAALSELRGRDGVRFVIVNWPYRALAKSDLDALVVSQGGRVIATRGPGQDEQLIPAGWTRLPAPFTTAMLKDALS